MKYMMIASAMVMLSMNGCFAMKYHLNEKSEIQMTNGFRGEEDPAQDYDSNPFQDRKDQFDYYPNFKALVEAIYNKDTQTALELIAVMTQEELNVDDYGRRTPLMIAIEQGQETIALALVNAMDNEGLFLSDMECVTALSYAYHYGMKNVAHAIEQKINSVS